LGIVKVICLVAMRLTWKIRLQSATIGTWSRY